MTSAEKTRIFSPLLLFVFHLTYLVIWSQDPLLKKWIDGSFTFFITLVLCNIIRANIVAKTEQTEQVDDAGSGPEDPDDPDGHRTP